MFYTINHNELAVIEPDSVKTLDFWIALGYSLIGKSGNGINLTCESPSNDSAVSSGTDSDQLNTPMVLNMIHVDILQSSLGDILALVQLELGSEMCEIGFTNKSVVQVVSLEKVVEVELLRFAGTDGEIL